MHVRRCPRRIFTDTRRRGVIEGVSLENLENRTSALVISNKLTAPQQSSPKGTDCLQALAGKAKGHWVKYPCLLFYLKASIQEPGAELQAHSFTENSISGLKDLLRLHRIIEKDVRRLNHHHLVALPCRPTRPPGWRWTESHPATGPD